jgi:predicted  nucleic acid-binding Zn-ribbon protein
MTENADVLRELHRIHQQLSDLRDRQASGPRQIKARETALAKAQADAAQIKAEQKVARVHADQKQLQLKSAETKVQDLKVKLNQAQSNREYQALRDQIAADEMAGSVLQDEILEMLEKNELFGPQLATAQQAVERSQEELDKTRKAVDDKAALVAGDIERLERELTESERGLPDDVRDAYQRAVKSRGAEAMASVENDTCNGCFQRITPNMANALQMGGIVMCNGCGRLLYLPEDRSVGRR